MADLNLIGAVGIRVRPDARRFRPETKAAVMAATKGIEGTIPLTPELTDGNVKAQAKRLAKEARDTVPVKLELDPGTVERDMKRQLASVQRAATITVGVEDDLDEARKRAINLTESYKRVRSEAKKLDSVRFTQLERAKKEIVEATERQLKAERRLVDEQQKLAKLQEEIASSEKDATLTQTRRLETLTARTQKFATEHAKAAAAREEAIKSEVRLTRELDAEQEQMNHRLILTRKRAAEVAAAYREFHKESKEALEQERLLTELTTGSRRQVIKLLEEQAEAAETYEETLRRILETSKAIDDHQFKDLLSWAAVDFDDSRVAHLRVEADTAMAEAKLQMLERDRRMQLVVRVQSNMRQFIRDMDHIERLKGGEAWVHKWTDAFLQMGRTVGGIKTFHHLHDMMRESVSNLDGLSKAMGTTTFMASNLGGAAMHLSGVVATLAAGLVQMTPGLAILPGIVAGLGTSFAAARKELAQFFSAARGNEEALEALAEKSGLAAEQAELLHEAFANADAAGQLAFWREMERELDDLAATMQPMADFWERSYASAGKWVSQMTRALNEWGRSGGMESTFLNISDAMDRSSSAGYSLVKTLLTLTEVGSKRLPGLADSLAEGAENMERFISAAAADGRLDAWIDEAGRQFKGLWRTLEGGIGIIDAMNDAARRAGYDGFVTLGDAMKGVSDLMHTPLYQHGMTELFKGAREGAQEATAGIREFSDAVMSAGSPLGQMAREAGGATGALLEMVGAATTNSTALQGLIELIKDIRGGIEGADRLFLNLGDAMGQGARIAGELFKAFVEVAESFSDIAADGEVLTRALEGFIPIAGRFAALVIEIAGTMTGPLMEALAIVLEGFNALPSGIQTAIMSLGLLSFALAKLKSTGATNIFSALISHVPVLEGGMRRAGTAVDNFANRYRMAASALRDGASYSQAARLVRNFSETGGQHMQSFASKSALSIRSVQDNFSKLNLAPAFTNQMTQAGRSIDALSSAGRIAAIGNIGGAFDKVKGAASGLVGFLGGPFGLVFIAATAAFAAFSQKAAEAEASIQSMRGTLDAVGNTTTQTIRQLSDSLNEIWSDHAGFGAFGVGAERVGEAFERTGMSATKLAEDIANSNGEWSDYRQSLADVQDALQVANMAHEAGGRYAKNAEAAYDGLSEGAKRVYDAMGGSAEMTEEMSIQLFGTADAAGMTAEKVAQLEGRWDSSANALSEARARQQEYAESMGLTSAEAIKLSEAMETMNSTTASTSDKIAAFHNSMEVLTGGTRGFLQSVNANEQAIGALQSAITSVSEETKAAGGMWQEYTNALGDASYRLDTTRSDLAAVDSALQSSYDSAVRHAQSLFDNAIAQGKTVSEASRIAETSMKEWRGAARDQLQALGGEAQQVEQYLTDIAGQDWQATLTFMGKADLFQQVAQEVESRGQQLDGETFTAFLMANPGASFETIKALMDKGIEFRSSRFSAALSFDSEGAAAELAALYEEGRRFSQEEFEALLSGDASGWLEAYLTAVGEGGDWDDQEYRASLGVDTENFEKGMALVEVEGAKVGDKKWVATMDLEYPGFAKNLYAAQAGLEGLTGKEWEAYVASNLAEVKKEQENLQSGLASLDGLTSEVTVKSNAAAQAVILEMYRGRMEGLDDKTIQNQLKLDDSEWNEIVDGLPGKWESVATDIEGRKAQVGAEDATAPGVTAAEESVDMFTGDTHEANLTAKNDTAAGIADADSSISAFSTRGAEAPLTAKNDTAPGITDADSSINMFTLKEAAAPLTAKDSTEPGILSALGSVFGRWITPSKDSALTTSDKSGDGIAAANSSVNGAWIFPAKVGSLTAADNSGTGIGAAQGSARSGWINPPKIASLTAQDKAHTGISNADRSARGGWSTKTYNSTLGARQGGLWTAIQNAATYLRNNWATKVFKAVLSAARSNYMGDFSPPRGYMNTGGFMRTGTTLDRFAYGGIRHGGSGRKNAQIKYPQGPNVTVWAEGAGKGNTAGEAFIPLAQSKRTRSTRILGLTAREMGYSVVQYNEGGITHIGGRSPGGAAAVASSAPGVSGRQIAAGVQAGLAGTRLTVGRDGEVGFANAVARGNSVLNRR